MIVQNKPNLERNLKVKQIFINFLNTSRLNM